MLMSNNQGPYARLPLQTVINCRDIGGYPTQSGAMTQWKRFLRSANLNVVSPEDAKFLTSYGVSTIIDLRTPYELKAEPNIFETSSEVTYKNVNLTGRNMAGGAMKLLEAGVDSDIVMGQNYINILDMQTTIKQVLDIILGADEGIVLYHCSAGKDRTGVISLILLGLADVSRTDIVSNYEISYTHIEDNIPELAKEFPLNMIKSEPINIKMAYDHIMTEYRGFRTYYEALGYSENEVQAIKARIIT